ncbi:MAG: tyrosine--tRNA ligase, partial [Muribaculaceae bacterium]|nr:tyrosine--tRNA ligase [Muribaculaceae bacterium]
YKFYQFWLNVSDEDAARYIKIFTDLTREEIAALEEEQAQDPGARPLQKRLAKEITTMVHSAQDYEMAVEASKILFSNQAKDILHRIDEATLLSVFEGVPQFEVSREVVAAGTPLIQLLTEHAAVFPSKGEMRKMTQGGGVSVNKEKVTDPNAPASLDMLLNYKYILAQRGKKNYYLLIVK